MARTKQWLISKLVSQHISKCIFYLAVPPLVSRRLRWAIGQTTIGASAGPGPAVLGPVVPGPRGCARRVAPDGQREEGGGVSVHTYSFGLTQIPLPAPELLAAPRPAPRESQL